MNRTDVMKPVVTGLVLVLMLVYFSLNYAKLSALGEQWAQLAQGKSAPLARIALDGRTVWEKPLLSTGFFDGSGTKQVHYLSIDRDLQHRLVTKQENVKVSVDGVAADNMAIQLDGKLIRADLATKRLYIASSDDFRSLALAAWQEAVAARSFIQCQPDALCQALKLSSQDWGSIQGPYLNTDIDSVRRGMPRGRWMAAPRTTINVNSQQARHIAILIDLLGLLPDQHIAFQGAVTRVQQVRLKNEAISISTNVYYPQRYIVYMDLKSGDNVLMISYSKWRKQARPGASALGGYLTGMKIK